MATKINFYERYATEHMTIDMDEHGLYCEVCSETHESVNYTVRVDESGVVPVATSCNCASHKPCKHMRIVNIYYAKIYKSNIEKAEAKQEQEQEAAKAIQEAENIVKLSSVEKSANERMMSASLNGNQGFSILRR